jgi:uncharacterized membrane protein YkoI
MKTTRKTTRIEKEISYNLPRVSAVAILNTLYAQAQEALESMELEFAFSNIFIDRGQDVIFAEVWIDGQTKDVKYMVGVNPNFEQDYPLHNYMSAFRQLDTIISSEAA